MFPIFFSKDNLTSSIAGAWEEPTATLTHKHQQYLEIPIFDVSAQTTLSTMESLRQTTVVTTPAPASLFGPGHPNS